MPEAGAAGRILVVDDEPDLREALRFALSREGFAVVEAAAGADAISAARAEPPDLVILDLLLPDMSGLDVCRVLRRESSVPILMLTARDAEIDRVLGLEIGADDYMTKPFSTRELVARARAMLRRVAMDRAAPAPAARPEDRLLRSGPVTLDPLGRRAYVRGREVALKPREFDLLWFLASHPGAALGRDLILRRVWGYDYTGDGKTVDVHVRWLREKIEEDPDHPRLIRTVRGVGYRFAP